jgi:hypothetical protein
MQINRTGYFLLALFGLGGIAFTIAGFVFFSAVGVAFVPLGLIWVLVTAALIVYAIRERRRGKHEEWLFETGVRGRGTLVSASSSATINDQPLVSLELDLEIPGQPVRRVRRRLIVSAFARPLMNPGVVLPVYVNPADPDDLLIVW